MLLTIDPRRMRRLIYTTKTRISDCGAKRIYFPVPSLACLWPIHTYFKARWLPEVHWWPLIITQWPCCYNSLRINITSQSSSSKHLHHIESLIPIKLWNRKRLLKASIHESLSKYVPFPYPNYWWATSTNHQHSVSNFFFFLSSPKIRMGYLKIF